MLSRILEATRFPVIIICEDSELNSTEFGKIVFQCAQQSIKVKTIKFNPITNAKMAKALGEVSRNECLSCSKQIIDDLVAQSHGDLNHALNTLQFGASKQSHSSKRQKVKMYSESMDDNFVLFHFVSKFLYAKRSQREKVTKLGQRPIVVNPLTRPNDGREGLEINPEKLFRFLSFHFWDYIHVPTTKLFEILRRVGGYGRGISLA